MSGPTQEPISRTEVLRSEDISEVQLGYEVEDVGTEKRHRGGASRWPSSGNDDAQMADFSCEAALLREGNVSMAVTMHHCREVAGSVYISTLPCIYYCI